jgi:hypothetical protein
MSRGTAKTNTKFVSRLNMCDTFDLRHTYGQSVSNGQLANTETRPPLLPCGKHQQVTNVCQIYHCWEHGLLDNYVKPFRFGIFAVR